MSFFFSTSDAISEFCYVIFIFYLKHLLKFVNPLYFRNAMAFKLVRLAHIIRNTISLTFKKTYLGLC